MNLNITPTMLQGQVAAPASKSVAHRALLCAALASGTSKLYNLGDNDDIIATSEAIAALGAAVTPLPERKALAVTGITSPPKRAIIDCKESGSTLRFMVPIAAALGVTATFLGRGELPNRPMEPLTKVLREHGIAISNSGQAGEILTIEGELSPGDFSLPGNISSQYITGLLYALPLLRDSSKIVLSSPLESSGYVDLTLQALTAFGVDIVIGKNDYYIPAESKFTANNYTVEGDYSGGAFWLSAGAIGSSVSTTGLASDSLQGDRKILELLSRFGATVNVTPQGIMVTGGTLKATDIDATEVPDLVPILAVVATQAEGITTIFNAGRLRIKECDRLVATADGLNRLGASVEELPEGLKITGKTALTGGRVSSYADHRIAMAMSIAATVASGEVVIEGADCVSKSYPSFYDGYQVLGGKVHGIDLGK